MGNELYPGQLEVDGDDFLVEDEGERAAFHACLDVGLARTSTGAKVFGAMKGAVDGGVNIPHSGKRFPGYDKEDGDDGKLHADVHRQHIFGQHVADYMTHLMEEDEEATRSSSPGTSSLESTHGIEGMYKKAHTAIRANPVRDAKPEKKVTKKRWTDKKLTSEARKQKVKDQKEEFLAQMEAQA